MVANILPAHSYSSPPETWGESIGKNSTFPQHGYVAYQIKGTHECSNMDAYIFPEDSHPPDPGGRGRKAL